MQFPIGESGLIITENERIYHLNLLPDELADTVIMVSHPDQSGILCAARTHIAAAITFSGTER